MQEGITTETIKIQSSVIPNNVCKLSKHRNEVCLSMGEEILFPQFLFYTVVVGKKRSYYTIATSPFRSDLGYASTLEKNFEVL